MPPRRAGPNIVLITIIRNLNAPRFSTRDYRRTVQQDASPGTAVVSVRATDADQRAPFNAIKYSIIGDDAAGSYFRIDEKSGEISVSNNLENDATREYKVRSNVLINHNKDYILGWMTVADLV